MAKRKNDITNQNLENLRRRGDVNMKQHQNNSDHLTNTEFARDFEECCNVEFGRDFENQNNNDFGEENLRRNNVNTEFSREFDRPDRRNRR